MNNTFITWETGERQCECGMMTHQYGVPMKESLLCKVLVFLADTPKSAGSRCPLQKKFHHRFKLKNLNCLAVTVQNILLHWHNLPQAFNSQRGLSLSFIKAQVSRLPAERWAVTLFPISPVPHSAWRTRTLEERSAPSLRPRDCWIIIICRAASWPSAYGTWIIGKPPATGAMAAASMLLQHYATESMYHQLQYRSDVSMKTVSSSESKSSSIPFHQRALLVAPLLHCRGCIGNSEGKGIHTLQYGRCSLF